MRVAVTGSSGLIGSALVARLTAAGHPVVRLVRGTASGTASGAASGTASGTEDRAWQPLPGGLSASALADVDAVVHLAGAGIGDRRWTAGYCRTLVSSRVDGTAAVAAAVGEVARQRPVVLLSASAVGYYGDTGDELRDESAPAGQGFLADLCRRWEAAAEPAAEAGARVAWLRTGIVLAAHGGALGRQLPLFRAGLGAPLGSGRQWLPWITLHDEVEAVLHCLEVAVSGPVNLVAPDPVTNRDFTRALGGALHRPTLPVAVPAFALRAALGDFADEGVLIGQRLDPRALRTSGFSFTHPVLDEALRATLS